uniref:Major facilitator superfamily (MFS) profile domain-containing protein n=1 Tax=Rhizochromulina marina TaxID=1034831 RepID=A0A7S2RZ22_9STRA|mmetsp:Transcript_22978/g.66834  ORF Transcript_22978/g.66834 Transcript_22978/m.66834 type:complete len:523 (+) Transcript_22978:21-1589(+)
MVGGGQTVSRPDLAWLWVKEAVREQQRLAAALLEDPRTRTPFLTLCLASFGSSLHEAVTTYFYLEVGASTAQIGEVSAIVLAQGIAVGPALGYWMDHRGSVTVMIGAAFFCALGCFLRGLAQSVAELYAAAVALGLGGASIELVILIYVSAISERSIRSTIVSGFVVQTLTLRILAKAAYPSFAAVLAAVFPHQKLLQYRVALSICWFFCFYGVVALTAARRSLVTVPLSDVSKDGRPLFRGGDGVADEEATELLDEPEALSHASSAEAHPDNEEEAAAAAAGFRSPRSIVLEGRTRSGGACCVFALASLSLVAQSVATTMGTVLWPLIVRDQFSWGAEKYAYLVLLLAIFRVPTSALLPPLERRLGPAPAALTVCGIAAASAVAVAVLVTEMAPADSLRRHGLPLLHSTLFLLHLVSLRALEVLLRARASLVLPPTWTSRSFGVAASLTALGGVVGSVVGTRMYVAGWHPLWVSTILIIMCGLFLLVSPKVAADGWTGWPSSTATPTQEGKSERKAKEGRL